MNQIIYKLEGPDQAGKHLELSVFAEKIDKFHKFLAAAAKDLGESDAEFRVVGMSHSSPATIICAPAGTKLPADDVIRRIQKNFAAVKSGKTENVRGGVLDALENFLKFPAAQVAREEIQFAADGRKDIAYPLNESFRKNMGAPRARNAGEFCASTVGGKLEQVNIHNGANKFKIYNSIFAVEGKFPEDLTAEVQKALGCYVSVSGKCFYKPGASFPSVIDVREMQILPPRNEVPSFWDFRGIAPDATGGKSAEEFVRESRAKWSGRIQ